MGQSVLLQEFHVFCICTWCGMVGGATRSESYSGGDTRVLLCLFLSLSPYVRKGYVRTRPEHGNLGLVNSERLAGQ